MKEYSVLWVMLMGILSFSTTAQAQSNADTTYWKKGATAGLTFNQVSLSNWQAGGENSVSGNINLVAFANYERSKISWDNNFEFGLGYNRQGDLQIKTDDRIFINSVYGYQVSDRAYLSLSGQFRTQFFEGYKSATDSTLISNLFAPAYVLLGTGIDFKVAPGLKVYLSPITTKLTIVLDQTLADQGAFGVEASTYNDLGELLTAGENSWWQMGSYLTVNYVKANIVKNVDFRTRLELYSNYLRNPQNLDVNGEIGVLLKVNSWLAANFDVQYIYDDDIRIDDAGPRLQMRQVFGVGLTFQWSD